MVAVVVASIGDIALTDADYRTRLDHAVHLVERIDEVAGYVSLNETLSLSDKLDHISSLERLKHRITKENKDVRRALRHQKHKGDSKQRCISVLSLSLSTSNSPTVIR